MDTSPGPEPADQPEAGVAPGDGDDGSEHGSEDVATGSEADDGKDPLRFNRWMKRSATGAVMTGIAVGLQQALELPKQQPAFVIEASGEPDDPDRPIDLKFDPDSPSNTVAIIRRPAAGDPADQSGSPDNQ